MRKRRLLWILYSSYVAVILLAVAALSGYTSRTMKSMYRERATADLVVRLRLMAYDLPLMYPQVPLDNLQRFCHDQAAITDMRITLISPQGRVLADSDTLPGDAESITYRSEFQSALGGKTGTALRRSAAAEADILYVAIPIWREGEVHGAIRAAIPLRALVSELRNLNIRVYLAGVVVALLAALVTLIISRWISRPVAEMVLGAERYAGGDFSHRIPVPASAEFGDLAMALNRMAVQLDEKIHEFTLKRNEQEAVLASLREAVIAVDNREHILFVNRAAARLLALDAERALGRLLTEAIRNSDLQRFITRMLSGKSAFAEDEITMLHDRERTLQVTGTILLDAAGQRLGVVVVLNDLTRLRKLETIRRDFVANVSHELKTPVTTIKGFVETLRDGAIRDQETAQGFLERISANTDRLNAIIDDLLTLSRVEQESEQRIMPLAPGNLREVVANALAVVETKAKERQVTIRLHGPVAVPAQINANLLEQAVVNLLDNAIKYSEPGQPIDVEVERNSGEGIIRVRGQGVGVAPEHLPRLFERFYRVDRARSRRLGGTGLGLSIVKHIAQAHGGTVTVESVIGRGSTFSIILPDEEEALDG